MDNLVLLIKEWWPIAQFIFILLIGLVAAIFAVMTFNAIEKFFNHTLPVIFRGWPPGYEEDNTNESEDITNESEDK